MLKPRWIALLAVWVGAAGEPPNPSFYVVNRAATAITRVYATPAGLPNWGNDRLIGGPLAPSQNAPIRLPADGTCVYDVRVVYASGRADERREVNTCELDNLIFPRGATTTAGPVPNRSGRRIDIPSFLLVNRGRAIINELYLSPSGNDSWGEDQLGDGTLSPGTSRTIRLPPGECLYDYRVVFANGEASEKRRVNLCQITDLKLP